MKLITTPANARWLLLSALVVVLDQATKWLAEALLQPYVTHPVVPMLNMTLMYNEGAAFSFLAGAGGWQRWFFIGFASLMTLVLTVWLLRLPVRDRLTAVSLALIVGGAVGNLIDRVLTGRVVDFIDVYYGTWHWPAFNIADSAISLGVVIMVVLAFRKEPEAEEEPR
jgi:signal peptidase II